MKNRGRGRVFFALSLVAMGIIFMGVSYGLQQRGQDALFVNSIQTLFSPVQKGISAGEKTVKNWFQTVGKSLEIKEENRVLQGQVETLKQELRAVERLKQENSRLREMLDLKDHTKQEEMVACEVIARSTDHKTYALKVDKGTKDGIQKGDIAAINRALVGIVTQAGENWATITTIFSSGQAVGGYDTKTQEILVLEADPQLARQGKLRISYIENEKNVAAGSYVETAGLGGIYPKGLLIGTICEKTKEPQTPAYTEIDTAVKFSEIQELFVIKKR